MKGKDQTLQLRKLSLSIGQFIRYWGFRRIHGAIWTQLYLSKDLLSCSDLTARLGLSKALISPALDELCKYKLIYETPSPNQKTKMYASAENISEVIQHILKTRETKMLSQITDDFLKLSSSNKKDSLINQDQVKKLGEMIFSANFMLEILVSQKNILTVPYEISD